MTKFTFIAVIFYLAISYSFAHPILSASAASFRENIQDLLRGKLNFSDTNIPYYTEELTDTTPQNNSEYDFIVIGAGSAGSTVAARLSENNQIKVLLIEAGGKEYPIMDIPLMAVPLQLNTPINWMYETESSDKYCLGFKDSKCQWPRGKVVGGSSVFNYMVATRGHKKDYDGWANSTGDDSWSYKNILKYLKKLENYQVSGVKINDEFHNKNGPLNIGTAPYYTKLTEVFIKANEELGLPLNDYNGEELMGVFYTQSTVKNGERWSTNRAYLHPAKSRENLFLTRNSYVTKILIDEKRSTAYGVQFTKGDKNIMVRTKKEIILCAGAINSPQILMLSGIGPSHHLNELGIHIIKDASVGENLMDHFTYQGLVFKVNDSAMYTEENIFDPNNPIIESYLKKRNGLLALGPGVNALSFVNIDSETLLSNEPNIELIFGDSGGIVDSLSDVYARALGISDDHKKNVLADKINHSLWSIYPMAMNPRSRGKLLLRSSDPNAKPKIYPNYLDHPEDVRVLIGGIRAAIRVSKTKAFQQYGSELYELPLLCEKFQFDSDAYWECALRTLGSSVYHPSGTCKMGKVIDKTAVVDSKLKVIGLKGLRVADASIIPEIVSAHPNIPVIAIAEKISDEIKQEWNINVK